MPGPIILKQDTLPWWTDPAKASVTDSLPVSVARKAVDLSGLGTAEGQLLGAAMPSPLVSIYKDKATREIGTRLFKMLASTGYFPAPLRDAMERFATKYPRVAAHINPQMGVPKIIEGVSDAMPEAVTHLPVGRIRAPIKMTFSPKGVDAVNQNPRVAEYLLNHEATHVAQGLGNNKATDLYRLASQLHGGGTKGYVTNPFELTATTAAENAAKVHPLKIAPTNAIKILQMQMDNVVEQNKDHLPSLETASDLYKILAERRMRGWTPSK